MIDEGWKNVEARPDDSVWRTHAYNAAQDVYRGWCSACQRHYLVAGIEYRSIAIDPAVLFQCRCGRDRCRAR